MRHETPPSAHKTVWAYAYEMVPPQPHDRLLAIKALLDLTHREAKLEARAWKGRLVVEEQITHILVVSDNPAQDTDLNRRLEADLRDLEVGFSITAAMAVPHEQTPPPRHHS